MNINPLKAVFSSPSMGRVYLQSVTDSAAPRRTRRQDSAWPVVICVIVVLAALGMVRPWN